MTESGMTQAFFGVIRRDLLLAVRRRSDVATSLMFFVIVTSLFPLGIGPEPGVLRTMAPGVIWVAALLSSMLSLQRLFASDYADGVLDQMVLSPHPLAVLAGGKIVAHWLIAGLPIVLLSPMMALQFGLSGSSIIVLVETLLLGTPTLSLLGSIGSALTLGVRGGGPLMALLVLPLFIPILIFGAGAVVANESGLGIEANVSLLGAGLLLGAALAPLATAAALRIAVE
ncbi:MAG TPA: heme exporter protein CcmB [Nitrospira sp.]|nr:heme exporter protein CcmB [Nitrospira sp.]